MREKILVPYVSGNILDLSAASKFYQKQAEIALELIGQIESLPGSRYRLRTGFDVFFFGSLPEFLAGHPQDPANALADSLFRLARTWAEFKRHDSLPGDRSLISDEALNIEWKRNWEGMKERDWEGFRRINSRSAQLFPTAIDENGKVDDRLIFSPDARRIKLGISFEQNTGRPPQMQIIVIGEPAVSFMIAYVRKSQGLPWKKGDKGELETLRTMFESLVHAVSKDFLGLARPAKGRPRDVGELAAYRIYHQQKPIYQVVRELCSSRSKSGHTCGPKCTENIKKAAKNHFTNLRRELRSLVKSR